MDARDRLFGGDEAFAAVPKKVMMVGYLSLSTTIRRFGAAAGDVALI
jgi:hypothetical protein